MMKGRRVEGKNLRRLKASKPLLHEDSNALYDYRNFVASSADSIQLKKPSGGPKGLIGPPCHGAPLAAGGNRQSWDYFFAFSCFFILFFSCFSRFFSSL